MEFRAKWLEEFRKSKILETRKGHYAHATDRQIIAETKTLETRRRQRWQTL